VVSNVLKALIAAGTLAVLVQAVAFKAWFESLQSVSSYEARHQAASLIRAQPRDPRRAVMLAIQENRVRLVSPVSIHHPPVGGAYAGEANAVQGIATGRWQPLFLPTAFLIEAKTTFAVFPMNDGTGKSAVIEVE
jgi:hypothetical protein